jgi:CheY-like chemotaxis protein
MTEKRSAGTRNGTAVAIRAGRTTAFVILAAGVEQALAVATPSLGGRSLVYLAAVVLVGMLEGFAAGLAAAVLSGVFLFFLAPVRSGLTGALDLTLIAMALAVVAALATRRMRARLIAARFQRSHARALLAAPLVDNDPSWISKEPAVEATIVAPPQSEFEDEPLSRTLGSDEQVDPASTLSDGEVSHRGSLDASSDSRAGQLGSEPAEARQREDPVRPDLDSETNGAGSQHMRTLTARLEAMKHDATASAAREAALQESLALIAAERDSKAQLVAGFEERLRLAESAAAATSVAHLTSRQEQSSLESERDASTAMAQRLAVRVEQLERSLDEVRENENAARAELVAIVSGRDAALGQVHSLAQRLEELEHLLSEANEAASERDANAVEIQIRTAELERAVLEATRRHAATAVELEATRSRLSALTTEHGEAVASGAAAGRQLSELESDLARAVEARTHAIAARDAAMARVSELERAGSLTRERDTALTQATASRLLALEERDMAVARIGELKRALAAATDRNALLEGQNADSTRFLAEKEAAATRIAALERSLSEATAREQILRTSLEPVENERAEAAARIEALETALTQTVESYEVELRTSESERELLLTRRDSLTAERDAASERNRALEAEIVAMQARLTQHEETTRDHERVTADLGVALERIAELSLTAAGVTEKETRLRESLARIDELTRHRAQAATRLTELEQALADSVSERAALRASIEERKAELQRLHEEKEQEAAAAAEENVRLRARLDEWRAAAEQTAIRFAERERTERERIDSEWTAKLTDAIEHLAREHASVSKTTIAEKNDALAAASALELQLRELRQEREAALKRVSAEWSDRLQSVVNEEAAKHSASIATANEALARARSEAGDLATELQALQERAEAEVLRTGEEWRARLQGALDELSARHAAGESNLVKERDEALAQTRDMTTRLHALQADLGTERARLESEWSEKLQTIVNNLASDHETDLGQALLEKMEARAEVRNLTMKLTQLQSQAEHIQPLVEAERRRTEEEWNAKLQTIVNNLASDHESDVGQAMMEREEARAEVRELTQRLAGLQAQIESDRQQYMQVRVRWNEERAQADAAHRQVIEELRAAAEREIALLHTRLEGLTRSEKRRAVVLLVQQDPTVRIASQRALESLGYDTIIAVDGLEALRLASSRHPSLVLADTFMPKVDGAELVQFLKSRSDTANIKVVLVWNSTTVKRDESISIGGRGHHADHVLAGATDIETLRTTLATVLAG